MKKLKPLFFCGFAATCSEPTSREDRCHHDVEFKGEVYGVDFCSINSYGWVCCEKRHLYTFSGITIVSVYDANRMVDVSPKELLWDEAARRALRMERAVCRKQPLWQIGHKLTICRCPRS